MNMLHVSVMQQENHNTQKVNLMNILHNYFNFAFLESRCCQKLPTLALLMCRVQHSIVHVAGASNSFKCLAYTVLWRK